MSQIEDVEAIHTYLLTHPSKTPAAETIRVNALAWMDKAGFWDKNLSQEWMDQLSTKRNQFNIANAVTAKDKAFMTQVLTTGMTTEEMQGKPRPKIDVKTGAVGSAIPHPLSISGQPIATRVLKKGQNGEDVKTWQSFLGLTPPTGYFDALTDTKTKTFQKSRGLVADGAVGKLTWGSAFPVIHTSDFSPSMNEVAAMFSPQPGAPNAPSPFSPSPSTQQPKPASKPAAQPTAATPATGTVAAAKTAVSNIVTAGMDPSGWSTETKVVSGLAAVALVVGAVVTKHGDSHQPSRKRSYR